MITRIVNGQEIRYDAGAVLGIEVAMEEAKMSTICQFRKKPVVIQAVLFTENNGGEVSAFVGKAWSWNPMKYEGRIDTLEGQMVASAGDWIIRGVKGEFYPCKPDIFEATYEPIIATEAKMSDEHLFRDNTDEYDERKDTEVISELDRLRVQLAGCSLAATGNVDDASLAQPGDYGYSKAYEEILALRREYESLRASHAELVEALRASLPIILSFVDKNPKWATHDGSLQDPMGSHRLLLRVNEALENARKVTG